MSAFRGFDVARFAQMGCATVDLKSEERAALDAVFVESAAFFSGAYGDPSAFASGDFNHGFRERGRQFSVSSDRPDLNDSFVYRLDTPQVLGLGPMGLYRALSRLWGAFSTVGAQVLHELGTLFGHAPVWSFDSVSYIEVNSYVSDSHRDMLQDRHQDGHVITLAASTAPGLEVEVAPGEFAPVVRSSDQLLVMAGSLLTKLTDGAVPPLYHRVRNLRIENRYTALFLLNTPFSTELTSLTGRVVDVAEDARNAGAMFGLPGAPDPSTV